MFGGRSDPYHESQYETASFRFDGLHNAWVRLQDLAVPRYGHRTIVHGDYIYHVGGNKDTVTPKIPFEEWKYDVTNDNFTITLSEHELDDYMVYPETFIVNFSDYDHCM